ncbi:MAG: hypothetical protein WBG38_17555, partial [Nodosilinea sp.]
CISAIAYHGLMFNEPVEDALYSEAPLTVVETLPQDLSAAEAGLDQDAASQPQGTVALWGLLSLVVLCGFGSFVVTQQIKASARLSKRKKPRPRPVPKPAASVPPLHPKRLAPYSPKRDGVVVPGARSVESAESFAGEVSGTAPRSVEPLPKVRASLGRSLPRVPAAATTPVRSSAVVPDEADLSLDWPEGSVAHVLDVRQRRSLSSFM